MYARLFFFPGGEGCFHQYCTSCSCHSPPIGHSLLLFQQEQAVHVEAVHILNALLQGVLTERKMGRVNIFLKRSFICVISVNAVSVSFFFSFLICLCQQKLLNLGIRRPG